MRIGFVSDLVYPFMKGGVERTEYMEMMQLRREHEIHSFSLQLEDMEPDFAMDGIHYHSVGKTMKGDLFRSRHRSVIQALKFCTLLPLILFGKKLDVIQANAFPYVHLPVVKLYCMLSRTKLIIDVAEVWSAEYWRSYIGLISGTAAYFFSNWVLKFGDAYITNPGAVKEALIDLGVRREKVFAFSPIIDSAAIARVPLKKGYERRVIFVGRLIKEKRLDKWLSVIENVGKQNALIIGDGPERDNIWQIIRSAKLSGKVSMTPPKASQAKMYAELRNSAVMLHMSEREGLGAVILESLALGTPVVLPTYSPVPDEVKRMCIVEREDKLPKVVSGILRAKDKRAFLRNIDDLKQFETGMIPAHYAKVFGFLGLR